MIGLLVVHMVVVDGHVKGKRRGDVNALDRRGWAPMD